MIFSLIIFIWLQKSGGANMHFFKSGGAKAPLPPASDAYGSTCVSTVLNLCHSYPQGYMEPFSHHSCVKNMDLTVTIFGNY